MKSYLFTTRGRPPHRKWVDAADEDNARQLFESRMRVDGLLTPLGVECLDRSYDCVRVKGTYNTRTDGTGRLVEFEVLYEPPTGRRLSATIDGESVHPSIIPDHELRIAITYGKTTHENHR